MTDYTHMREIAWLAREHGPITMSWRDIWVMFRQPERATPLGDGIMNLCGLPTEKESFERWLRANELMALEDVTKPWGDVKLVRVRDNESAR